MIGFIFIFRGGGRLPGMDVPGIAYCVSSEVSRVVSVKKNFSAGGGGLVLRMAPAHRLGKQYNNYYAMQS